MNKMSIFFIILMLILTVIAVIPMFGLPPITYGYGSYSIDLTPAMVVIIISTIDIIFALITVLISGTVSSHMEKSIANLAEKLASCQYEKNKLIDEKSKLEQEVKNIKELYEKQLKIIEKVTLNNNETENTITKESTDQQEISIHEQENNQ